MTCDSINLLSGTQSRNKQTTFACCSNNSSTSHDPSRPVAPVTKTFRFFQKLISRFSRGRFRFAREFPAILFHAWYRPVARNHHVERPSIDLQWSNAPEVRVQNSSHHFLCSRKSPVPEQRT